MNKRDIDAEVREYGGCLLNRLYVCQRRIGLMCSEGRPPTMTIPPRPSDEGMFITVTLRDAAAVIGGIIDAMAEVPDDALSHPSLDRVVQLLPGSGSRVDIDADASNNEKERDRCSRCLDEQVAAILDLSGKHADLEFQKRAIKALRDLYEERSDWRKRGRSC